MAKIFQPTRENLHPKIMEFFEKAKKWHEENGYIYGVPTVDDILKLYTGWDNGSFIILIQDTGEKHHGNCVVKVFNKDGSMVDERIYFNPLEGQKAPRKAFIGTPIISGSKVMQYKQRRKKDKPFQPPV